MFSSSFSNKLNFSLLERDRLNAELLDSSLPKVDCFFNFGHSSAISSKYCLNKFWTRREDLSSSSALCFKPIVRALSPVLSRSPPAETLDDYRLMSAVDMSFDTNPSTRKQLI